jgi:hypothetical protein
LYRTILSLFDKAFTFQIRITYPHDNNIFI